MSARALGLALWLALTPVLAADRPLGFPDPVQQARYEGLLAELRCLVCQNQSLADSHAELAQDLREQVHAMIGEGEDNAAIVAFLRARYGDFVLYRPPLRASTVALWLGPFVLLGVALVAIARRARRQPPAVTPLAPAERARLAAMLERDEREAP
jgi:cytochrome c-type biogenesis protein CcmH